MDTEPTEPETERDPRIEKAREAANDGRAAEAIELFEDAARAADGARADRLWLRAGILHAREGERISARQALARVDAESESDAVATLRQLLSARLRLTDNPEQTVEALSGGPPKTLPDELNEYWLETQARALRDTDRPLEAARLRNDRQRLLTADGQASANRKALWQDLMAVPLPRLRSRVPATEPNAFGGWLELAHAVRVNRLDPDAMRQAIDAWYERYPDHTARQTAFSEAIYQRASRDASRPQRVAVLLPLSGRLEAIGRAVQNGIITSYFAGDDDPDSELLVYDLGDNGRDPDTAYQDAVDRGVDLVIGPLTKGAVNTIAERDEHPVPVLALNRAAGENGSAAAVYQFGLAPEDDAREAARLIDGNGWDHVVALAPRSNWGDRVLGAFSEVAADNDAKLLAKARYEEDAQDVSAPIKGLFNLDDSEARYRRLVNLLSRSMKFEPRRRRDIEAIFLAAFPNQARLIKPQIRFHRGIGLPVVATSHAYSGYPDPGDDKDLDDLIVVDTPWTLGAPVGSPLAGLKATAIDTWPEQARDHPRLLALGIDALRLAGPVDVLAKEPSLDLVGLTGRLRVDSNRVVHRSLLAGRFGQGVLLPLVEEPEMNTEASATKAQGNAEEDTDSAP